MLCRTRRHWRRRPRSRYPPRARPPLLRRPRTSRHLFENSSLTWLFLFWPVPANADLIGLRTGGSEPDQMVGCSLATDLGGVFVRDGMSASPGERSRPDERLRTIVV